MSTRCDNDSNDNVGHDTAAAILDVIVTSVGDDGTLSVPVVGNRSRLV